MLVAAQHLVELLVREPVVGVGIERQTADRVFLCEALRSRDRMEPVVGPRRGDVVLDEDALAPGRADQRRIHVAQRIGPLGLRRLRAVLRRGVGAHAELVGRERDEPLHAVAAVDVEQLAQRT